MTNAEFFLKSSNNTLLMIIQQITS